MVPQFHVVGKRHKIPASDDIKMMPKAAIQFWDNERKLINNAVHPDVYIGLLRNGGVGADFFWYLPSVQMKTTGKIPEGFFCDTFRASLCARFRYIGQHHYYDINGIRAGEMYNAIQKFFQDENVKYVMPEKVVFEKIDTSRYDGTYCQLEWFAPIEEKKDKMT